MMMDVVGDDADQLLPLQVLSENTSTGPPGTGQTDSTETEMRNIQPDIPIPPAGPNPEKFQDAQGHEITEGLVIMGVGDDQLILTLLIKFRGSYCSAYIYPVSMKYLIIYLTKKSLDFSYFLAIVIICAKIKCKGIKLIQFFL